MKGSDTVYILATGSQDVERLHLLNQLYGPASEAVLRRAGMAEGSRVVEIGCGAGNMTCWIARQVGESGCVFGMDKSLAQIEQARRQADALGLTNVTFVEGTAYSPPLPPQSFDVVYSRLVLMHLQRPLQALQAMGSLLWQGGRLVCEELDLTSWLCNPQARCVEQFIELNLKLGERRGEDFRLGGSLHRLFRAAGFRTLEVAGHMPLVLRGPTKRLLWMTFGQFAPGLVEEGLASAEEVQRVGAELLQVADDDTTLLGLPLMVQVWGVK